MIWLFIFATATWVLIDAKKIGVRKGLISGMGNMGPWAWFLGCILLWILTFPLYLLKRKEFKLANQGAEPQFNTLKNENSMIPTAIPPKNKDEGSKKMGFDFKNAQPAELKAEYSRIAQEIGDDQFFTKKELNHLPEILADGEQVLAFTSGLMDGHTWLITLTDRRVIFLDKGMIYGLKQTTIDLDKVNAISGETGIFLGKIKVEDGAKERQIENVWKKTVVKFTNKARDAIEARKRLQHSGPAPTSVKADDLFSKLEKLAGLMEKGILSQQEFDQQKAKLLAE